MKKMLLIALISCLNGCFSSSEVKNEGKATEVPNKDMVQTDLSQGELFQKSKRLYENALYTTSQESFQSLKDAYSPGPYSEFAEIKLADAQFELRKYDTAATAYEEFIKNHPASPSLPYAMLKAGRSYELQNLGAGRDIGPLEKAKEHYEKLFEQYPDSVYSFAGRKYYQSIAEKMSAHEQFVLDYYRRKENQEAIDAREKQYAATVKPMLDKASYQNSAEFEAARNSDNKKKKYASPEILDVQRVSSVSLKRKIPAAGEAENQAETERPYRIQSIVCDITEGRNMYIFLNKEFENQPFLKKYAVVEESYEGWHVKLPETASKDMILSCFNESDLIVSKDGEISLKTSGNATLMALSNPPRLLVSFE